MIFIKSVCENSSVLKIVMFLELLFKAVFILVPIGLIVMMSVDIGKNVISGNADVVRKNMALSFKRLLFTITLFFVPTIVEFVNAFINDIVPQEFSYNDCLDNANSVDIEKYANEEYNEKQREVANRKSPNIGDINTEDPYSSLGGSLNVNPLPDDEKYYPLNGKDMDGNQTELLKIDGKYLTDAEMDEMQKYIEESINKAGTNWKKRVAAAAYALIFGLNEKGLRIIYEYGGGAGSLYKNECTYGTFCKKWGEKNAYKNCANGSCYNNTYRGLDCAGFVKYAVNAGCGANVSFAKDSYKVDIDFDKLEPGDILTYSGSYFHALIFLKKSSDGKYIVAECTRGNNYGTVFTKKDESALSGYKKSNLDEVYNQTCSIKDNV